jgi:UDP-N-acetylmuramoyl-tripeptide--D-alanyl-D-alanine ligase
MVNVTESVILNRDEMAKATNGFWSCDAEFEIFSIGMLPRGIQKGTLAIAANPKKWKNVQQDSHNHIKTMLKQGAVAVMVDQEWFEKNKDQYNVPFLVVDNTFTALHDLAFASRDTSQAKRVLVTGTEGKTSTKYGLNYLISNQAPSYAQETSANLTVPILFSLCSLKKNSEFTVVEVSCPQPNRCVERSDIISPNIVVITNLNQSHMNTHGSIANLIKHKYESLHGLQKDGVCIINEDTDLYDDFREYAAKQDRKITFLTFSAKNPDADAYLVGADFENLSWKVKAEIENETVDYQIDRTQGHWPLMSLGLLLCIKCLGLDVHKAAGDFGHFDTGWDSMGQIQTMAIGNGSFLFYDQYFSITEKALKSALEDVKRIQVQGKKIVVASGELNSAEFATDAHKRIAQYLDDTDIDVLYTVGEFMDITVNALKNIKCFKGHFFSTNQLKDTLIEIIEENDLVFIKGMTKLNFKLLSDAINNTFKQIK